MCGAILMRQAFSDPCRHPCMEARVPAVPAIHARKDTVAQAAPSCDGGAAPDIQPLHTTYSLAAHDLVRYKVR